jgi:hypothetical protein
LRESSCAAADADFANNAIPVPPYGAALDVTIAAVGIAAAQGADREARRDACADTAAAMVVSMAALPTAVPMLRRGT